MFISNLSKQTPGAESDAFQISIESEDLPDIYRGLNNFYKRCTSNAVEEDIIYDLAPYMEEYAPDYRALRSSDTYAAVINDVYDDKE